MALITIFQHTAETQRYAPGEVIFREGEPSRSIYIIRSGTVELVRRNAFITSAGAGKLVGLAFIAELPHIVTATALTECTLVPIDRERWEFMVQHTPHFATDVMAILVEQLHAFIDQLASEQARSQRQASPPRYARQRASRRPSAPTGY